MENDQNYSLEEMQSLLQLRWELDNLRSNSYATIIIFLSACATSPVIAFSQKTSSIALLLQILLLSSMIVSWIMWGKFSAQARNLHTKHFNKSKGPDPFRLTPIVEVIFQNKIRYASLCGAICHVCISWFVNIFLY